MSGRELTGIEDGERGVSGQEIDYMMKALYLPNGCE